MKKFLFSALVLVSSVMLFAQGADDWRIHPNDAKYYIKGVFDASDGTNVIYTLTNVETSGVTLNNPKQTYYGDYQDAHDDVMFTFNDVETTCPTKYDYISYWVYDDEINEWQPDVEIRSADRGMEHRKIMTVMLVLDCSSSLENEFVHDLKYVKEGALTFLRTMYNASRNGNIQIGIIGFNSMKKTQIRNIEPLNEGTYGEMCRFINNFDVANGTALYYSLDKAVDMTETYLHNLKGKDYVTPIIVTFTDGVDQTSFDNKKGIKNADSYYSVVNNKIHKADIEHFVVPFLGSDIKTDAQKDKFKRVLRSLTKPNDNSHYLPVTSMSELSVIFGRIANNLIDRWQILRCYVAPARQGKVCWTFGRKEAKKTNYVAPEPEKPKSERKVFIGINGGPGIPFSIGDNFCMGLNLKLGVDFAYPVADRFAIGAYTSFGGGMITSFDDVSGMGHFNVGLLMLCGDMERPLLIGISPCAGIIGGGDSMTLPFEFRIGRIKKDHFYMTYDLLLGPDILNSGFYFEPRISFGYHFGKPHK